VVYPHLYGGKKGRYTATLSGDRKIAEPELRQLAHQFRELHGVKRAYVRGHLIHVQVNVSVRRIRQNLKKVAFRFCRTLGYQHPKKHHHNRKGHFGPPPHYTKKVFIPAAHSG
jgi:hypothetical protein